MPDEPLMSDEELKRRFSALLSALASVGTQNRSREEIANEAQARGAALDALPPVTVAYPPCTDELLSLVPNAASPPDEVRTIFEEYFRFGTTPPPLALPQSQGEAEALKPLLDPRLLECARGQWPDACCIPRPCVILDGRRGEGTSLKRLFIADVVWLFFMDRLGLPQILGAILDSYAYEGRLPISNGSLEPGLQDDLVALVLEVMTRQVKSGVATSSRERATVFRRTVGWTTEFGRKANLTSEINAAFDQLFHKFIHLALQLYKDRRLAQAIRGAGAGDGSPTGDPGNISMATVTALGETARLLVGRFETFHYGRSYTNTLGGIVWVIAALSILRLLTDTLGIPRSRNTPDEYVPAAYDLLVMKRPITTSEVNRYTIHRDCADSGRHILLGLEALKDKLTDTGPSGAFYWWIFDIEDKVERYRSAYRLMTGIDLGNEAGLGSIEQRA